MESVLSKTTSQSLEEFGKFSQTLGGAKYIELLLDCITNSPSIRTNPSIVTHLARVVAALTYANEYKMSVLMSHFRPYPLDFDKFDTEHLPEDEQKLELFSILAVAIDKSELGNTLKDYILSLGIVHHSLDYIRVSSCFFYIQTYSFYFCE